MSISQSDFEARLNELAGTIPLRRVGNAWEAEPAKEIMFKEVEAPEAGMVPQEAVVALARHNFEESYRHLGWDELTDDVRAGWLKQAQAQCEAAAPLLRAQALEDAASAAFKDKSIQGLRRVLIGNYLRARAATERGQHD